MFVPVPLKLKVLHSPSEAVVLTPVLWVQRRVFGVFWMAGAIALRASGVLKQHLLLNCCCLSCPRLWHTYYMVNRVEKMQHPDSPKSARSGIQELKGEQHP